MKNGNIRTDGLNVGKLHQLVANLTTDTKLSAFDVCIEIVPTGERSSCIDRTEAVDRFVYVLEGELQVYKGERAYDLRDGDSLALPNGVSCSIANVSMGRSRLLIVTARGHDRVSADEPSSSLHLSPPEVGVAELGRAIRRVARAPFFSARLYDLLSPWSCGPFDGGCLIVASALQRVAGRGELVVLVGCRRGAEEKPSTPQHVMLRIDDRFLDADGSRTFTAMRSRWFERERTIVDSAALLSEQPFSRKDAEIPPFSERAVEALEQLIRQAIRS